MNCFQSLGRRASLHRHCGGVRCESGSIVIVWRVTEVFL